MLSIQINLQICVDIQNIWKLLDCSRPLRLGRDLPTLSLQSYALCFVNETRSGYGSPLPYPAVKKMANPTTFSSFPTRRSRWPAAPTWRVSPWPSAPGRTNSLPSSSSSCSTTTRPSTSPAPSFPAASRDGFLMISWLFRINCIPA